MSELRIETIMPPETRAERRERIAVQMMRAITGQGQYHCWEDQAHDAIAMANALMAELDKAAAEDAKETKQ